MGTEAGVLYLVGTPIGNLEDITLRALRVLSEVDVVAAEDTRVTRGLLARHGLRARLISYHEHSGPRRAAQIVEMLRAGRRVALVSDAGMPGISDPGARLVRACVEAGVAVTVVPGPTAVSAALALSGLPTREFLFLGFLPERAVARQETLRRAAGQPGAIVFFEAPHRLRESLRDVRAVLGDREAACARELTKQFEEVVRGRVSDLVAHFAVREPRGEMTVVLAGAQVEKKAADLSEAVAEVRDLVAAGLSRSRAVAHVARHRGLQRRALYRAALDAGDGEP
jgi:16S rRNA (cytidine1402-2'-O)-methyltransferase